MAASCPLLKYLYVYIRTLDKLSPHHRSSGLEADAGCICARRSGDGLRTRWQNHYHVPPRAGADRAAFCSVDRDGFARGSSMVGCKLRASMRAGTAASALFARVALPGALAASTPIDGVFLPGFLCSFLWNQVHPGASTSTPDTRRYPRNCHRRRCGPRSGPAAGPPTAGASSCNATRSSSAASSFNVATRPSAPGRSARPQCRPEG